MIRLEITKKIIAKLKKDKIEEKYANPNFIADYSYNRGYKLTSNEVVYISNNYKEI